MNINAVSALNFDGKIKKTKQIINKSGKNNIPTLSTVKDGYDIDKLRNSMIMYTQNKITKEKYLKFFNKNVNILKENPQNYEKLSLAEQKYFDDMRTAADMLDINENFSDNFLKNKINEFFKLNKSQK